MCKSCPERPEFILDKLIQPDCFGFRVTRSKDFLNLLTQSLDDFFFRLFPFGYIFDDADGAPAVHALADDHVDLLVSGFAVRNFARWSPPVIEAGADEIDLGDGGVLQQLIAHLFGQFAQNPLGGVAIELQVEDLATPGYQRNLGVLGIFREGANPVDFLLDLLVNLLLVCVSLQLNAD